MRIRLMQLALVPLLFVAGVPAQAAPQAPPPSDRWTAAPAPASSVDFREGARQDAATDGQGHFKFKERRTDWRTPPPADPSGKAPVNGGMQIGPDGRPGVDCMRTPMDSACR